MPRPGAVGYQLSNPSALDLSAVIASLEIFGQTSMSELRRKSAELTLYLERLLLEGASEAQFKDRPFDIITPKHAEERGAQLSIRLKSGLLDTVLKELEKNAVVVDERKPDVVRVAPAPLYNTFVDVWRFSKLFLAACLRALKEKQVS